MKCWLSLMAVLLFLMEAVPGNATEALDLVERAWDGRQALQSGEVTVRVVRNVTEDMEGSGQEATFHIAFTAQELRVDRLGHLKSNWPSADVAVGLHHHKMVFGDREFIQHTEVQEPNARSTAANISYLDQIDERERTRLTRHPYLLDPRCLGIVTGRFANIPVTYLNDTMDVLRRSELMSHGGETMESGIEAHRISFQTDLNEVFTLWISPTHEHSVLQASLVTERDGQTYERVVKNELAEFKAGNHHVWFPKIVVYELLQNNARQIREECFVEHAVFNQPVQERLFSLSGMRIPAGTYVAESPRSSLGTRIWDGNELVPINALPIADQIAWNGGVSIRRMLVITLAIMGVISFVAWRMWRVQTSAS